MKPTYAAATLLASCCLLSPRASFSQALRPPVVRLDSGVVAKQAYNAFTLPAYRQLLAERRADSLALVLDRRTEAAQDSLLATKAAKNRALQRQLETGAADYAKLAGQANRALALPLRPPLLGDVRLLLGAAAGALLALFLTH